MNKYPHQVYKNVILLKSCVGVVELSSLKFVEEPQALFCLLMPSRLFAWSALKLLWLSTSTYKCSLVSPSLTLALPGRDRFAFQLSDVLHYIRIIMSSIVLIFFTETQIVCFLVFQ